MSKYFIILILLEALALLLVSRWWQGWELPVITVNMILILLFGGKLITIGGYTSNAGNIFYAAVCTAQLMLAQRVGERAALTLLPRLIFALTLLFGLLVAMSALPILPGNEPTSEIINALSASSARLLVASYLAYFVAQIVLLKVYINLPITLRFGRYLLAAVACQFLDSVIFFAVAFQAEAMRLVEIALVGCTLKVALMVLYFPLFHFAAIPNNEIACITCPVINRPPNY